MTHGALRGTWNSEQWVIDHLVEAVEAGNSSAKQRLGNHWLAGAAEHDWSRWRHVDSGLFLAPENLEETKATPDDLVELFDGHDGISEQRLEELRLGAPMQLSELAVWRQNVVERAFSEELAFEQDQGIVWVIVELKHSKRGRCCVGILDWEGSDERFVAAYGSTVEIANALKALGFVSEDDYRARGLAAFGEIDR